MAGRTETRKCEHCQKQFQFEIWRGKYYPGRFCSTACKNNSQQLDIATRLAAHLGEQTATGCIEWIGKSKGCGYGRIHAGDGSRKMLLAHRVAWELANGRSIPKGMFVCHLCDNHLCCNPEHLFVGKPKDNSEDMTAKKRQAYGERQHSAKLTDEKVRQIIRLYRGGTATITELASLFGVTRKAIQLIVIGKTWKHVTVH
jgi:hypothetical protein